MYGINDSKKLTEKKREALFDEILDKALAYKIVFVGPEIIDRDNILNATMSGMKQAAEGLDIVPNLVLVDGNRVPAALKIPAQPVVKGDATSVVVPGVDGSMGFLNNHAPLITVLKAGDVKVKIDLGGSENLEHGAGGYG